MIIYEGPSALDGAPVVCIATISSNNEKTGDMVQTWIMRADVDPVTASRMGTDASVCGDCPLRGIAQPDATRGQAAKRGCYVALVQAPLTVWKAYKAGRYRHARTVDAIVNLGRDRMVRIGSYGDGAAIPGWVTSALQSEARGHTAYSHQWRNARSGYDARRYMASVQGEAEARDAWALGHRTYRIVGDESEAVPGFEIACPSSRGVQCADCGLCGGTQVRAKSIVIANHGSGRAAAAALLG
jgi:hypothetical protein